MHYRDNPGAFVCPRCNEASETKPDYIAHCKCQGGCESKPMDLEDGVDGETIVRIIDRKRETIRERGKDASIEEQWLEIWVLLFPGTSKGGGGSGT
jgi:hypothetical protein